MSSRLSDGPFRRLMMAGFQDDPVSKAGRGKDWRPYTVSYSASPFESYGLSNFHTRRPFCEGKSLCND